MAAKKIATIIFYVSILFLKIFLNLKSSISSRITATNMGKYSFKISMLILIDFI